MNACSGARLLFCNPCQSGHVEYMFSVQEGPYHIFVALRNAELIHFRQCQREKFMDSVSLRLFDLLLMAQTGPRQTVSGH
jgi:hypothetical protein